MTTTATEGRPPGADLPSSSMLPDRPPWLRLVAASTGRALAWGLAAGVVGGAVYRAFMALLTPDPTFTWEGTLFIVGFVSLAAVLVALCARARAAWSNRTAVGAARVLAGLSFVLLGNAQGMVLVPVWLLGGLALGRLGAPPLLRRIGFGLALAAVAAFIVFGFVTTDELGAPRLLAASAFYVGIAAAHVLGFTAVVGSPPPRQQRGDVPASAPVHP